MELATWILVIFLSVTLFIFLVVAIVLVVRLIGLTKEAQKIVVTGQQIATKADDIVDNVKGVTSVGGIVKTFANRVIENQERKYAAEDAAREEAAAAEAEKAAAEKAAVEKAVKETAAKAAAAKTTAKKPDTRKK